MSISTPFVLAEGRAVLAATPATLSALLTSLPEAVSDASEGPGTWSPRAVLQHLVWGEVDDWMPRVRTLREFGAARAFAPFDRDEGFKRYADWPVARLLAEFSALRSRGLAELDALVLTPADLAAVGRHPEFGVVTLEQLLATWVTHDLSHLAQIARVLARHAGRHVGPWRAYFSLLREEPPPAL